MRYEVTVSVDEFDGDFKVVGECWKGYILYFDAKSETLKHILCRLRYTSSSK